MSCTNKLFLPFLFVVCSLSHAYGQHMQHVKVHFLYGSTPKKEFSNTEPKWFGGILGGHVGIEIDSNQILNFVPQGSFHLVAKREKHHSRYAVHDTESFYSILGGKANEAKKMVLTIPISLQQKQTLDSIATAYLAQTPYDYALAGMRCGAAAYEILAQLNILPSYDYRTTAKLIIYPAVLRNKLLRLAAKQHWVVEREEGSVKRCWEKG